MPELPEVETVLRRLRPALIGRTIVDLAVLAPKTVRTAGGLAIVDLRGERVEGIWRRGKLLIWNLSGGKSLVFHFKLTGQLVLSRDAEACFVGGHPIPRPGTPMPTKATRAVVRFDGGSILYFNDVRRFGWIVLMPTADVDAFLQAQHLGPEPFSPEFTPATLTRAFARFARSPVKSVLLDQSVVAGLGNIYSDEALFLARISPLRPAGSLTAEETERLSDAIRKALAIAIEQSGATIIGNRAVPKDEFPKVHGRAEEPCFACGSRIERVPIGGRSSYFCPRCQT